ncbi:sigma-70 family RNA polymerase sigma factor [Myxococcota bacterium]
MRPLVSDRPAPPTAEEERHYARGIEMLDQQVWMLILDEPSATDRLHETMASSSFDVGAVADVVDRVGVRRPLSVLRRAAEQLLSLDRDRQLLDAVVGQVSEDNDLLAIRDARAASRDLRDQFVSRNLGLVFSLARRFPRSSLPYPDLLQEGTIGLILAVHRFDYRRDVRFASYAFQAIRRAISRAVLKASHIRIPQYLHTDQMRVARASNQLLHELGRAPRRDELRRATGLTAQAIARARQHPQSASNRATSVAPAIVEAVADTSVPTPDEAVHTLEVRRLIHSLLTQLDPKEQEIVRRRFGLENGKEETLEQIGRDHNLSRERIRQLEAKALVQLRQLLGEHLS